MLCLFQLMWSLASIFLCTNLVLFVSSSSSSLSLLCQGAFVPASPPSCCRPTLCVRYGIGSSRQFNNARSCRGNRASGPSEKTAIVRASVGGADASGGGGGTRSIGTVQELRLLTWMEVEARIEHDIAEVRRRVLFLFARNDTRSK